MLGTIEQLEQEIRTFKDNVAASNEMYSLLEQMIEQIKTQNLSFTKQSGYLMVQLEKAPDELEQRVVVNNKDIKQGVENEIDRAIKSFVEQQDSYLRELEATKIVMKRNQEQLENKYQDFMQSLDKVNMSHLYDQNQQLRETLNKRTTVLMVISILSLVCGLIGFII